MNLFVKHRLAALFLSVCLVSSVLVSCDDDDDDDNGNDVNYTLSGTASGANERPNPVTTSAGGTLTGTYNATTKQMSYTVTWNGLTGAPIAAHFHGPAGVNEIADPVITITLPAGAGTTGTVTGNATLTTMQETQLLAGQWYYNIHTPTYPDGEIRAQVSATR
jgi:hypothetical protein